MQELKQRFHSSIERHRRLGESISILKDGKVVTLNADQIPPLDEPKNHDLLDKT